MKPLIALLLLTSAAHAGCNDTLLTVGEWKVVPADSDTVKMSVTFKSTANKAIKMMDAKAGYIDALGDVVVTFNLDKDVDIAAGADYAEVKVWDREPFKRMLQLRHDDVKTFVCVEAVLFGDGTKQRF